MASTSTLNPVPGSVQTVPYACHLRRKEVVGRRGPLPFMAEVEVENLSAAPLNIDYRLTALQFFNLTIWDASGKVISKGHYADRFSPTEKPTTLRLGSGEKFAANVHLFATTSQWPLPPGCYVVQAAYEYGGFRAVSDKLEVTV